MSRRKEIETENDCGSGGGFAAFWDLYPVKIAGEAARNAWEQLRPSEQAVLEGVAFAIRDSVEVARSLGITINTSKICGGGAKSALWKRIFANVLNIPLELPVSEQGPGMGAAMLAMVACGDYPDVAAACEKMVSVASVVTPEPELAARYEARYQQYRQIYPAVKQLFPLLQ